MTKKNLQEFEEKYRKLIEIANDAIFLADVETGIFLEANKQTEELLGVPVEEIVGNHHTQFYPTEYVERNNELFKKYIQIDKAITSEDIFLQHKDGRKIPVEISSSVFELGGRKVILGIFRNITERKRAEKGLLESEENYQILANSTKAISWVCDVSTWQFTFVGAYAETLLGYRIEEWYQENFWQDHIHPDDREHTINYCVTSTRRLEDHEFEYRMIASDGQIIWIYDIAKVTHSKGEPIQLHGFMIDITERKRMEEELRMFNESLEQLVTERTVELSKVNEKLLIEITERKKIEQTLQDSEERYRSLINDVLDTSNVGVFILDKEFRVVWINRTLESYFGMKRDGIIMKDKRRLIKGNIHHIFEDGDKFKERVIKTYDDNTYVENFVCHILPGDGREERWLEHWSQPIVSGLYAGGRVEQYTDITKRKKVEGEIRKLTHAIEQSSSTVVITDTEGNIEYVNPKFTQLTGYTAEEAIGNNPRILKTDKTPPEEYKSLWKTITSGSEWRGEFCNKKKSGELYWELASISPVKNKEGVITNFIAVKEDITERKKAEESFNKQARIAMLGADIGVALTMPDTLRMILQRCSETVVNHLDAAFARIWTFDKEENMLELQASSGIYTCIDGSHSRVPVGSLKIGLIAQEQKPHLTNDVMNDPCISDKEWVRREGVVAFAGYPLIVEGRLVGVMAMFACQQLTKDTLDALASVSNAIALGIERKRGEERLKKFELLFNNISDLAYICDAEGNLLFVNNIFEKLSGHKPEEFIGNSFAPLFDEENLKKAIDIYTRTLKGESSTDEIYFKDTRILCEYKNIPLRNDNGNIIGVIGIARDITKRKRMEEDLKRTTSQLSLMLESLPIIPYICKAEGNFGAIYVGTEVEKVTGFKPESFTSNDTFWADRIHPDDAPRVFADLSILFEKGHYEHEYRWQVSDNSYKWFYDVLRLVKLSDKTSSQIVGIWLDITERKKTEDILQEQKMALEQKNIALGEVLGQIEIEKKQIKENVIANAENLLLPIIQKLRLTGESRKYVQLLRKNLQELTSSFGTRLTERGAKLTSREVEICDMIKNGLTSKEIASLLNISLRTVDAHRIKIRKKLGLINKDINLASFLNTL